MFNIPKITKYLLIINVAVYLFMSILGMSSLQSSVGIDGNDIFGLHFFLAPDFRFYQLFTYMFMHGSFQHLFFNMFALWMFGCVVENVWGPKKFLFYYILCGFGAGVFQEMAQFGEFYVMCSSMPYFHCSDLLAVASSVATELNRWTTVGASGAVYAILLAFGMIFPEQRIFIFPLPVPIKAKWFVIIYAAVELFSALSTTSDGVAHVAHLGGMVFGFFLIRYWRNHPTVGYGTRRGGQFFDNLRSGWEKRTGKSAGNTSYTGSSRYTSSSSTSSSTRTASDWDYNAQKAAKQKEIDLILDKIRKSGYDSLTKEEKQKLFDQSKN